MAENAPVYADSGERSNEQFNVQYSLTYVNSNVNIPGHISNDVHCVQLWAITFRLLPSWW